MIKVTRSFVASCRTNYNLMTSFNAAEFGRQPFITILRPIRHFIYRSGCDGGNTLGNNVAGKPFPLAGGLCIVEVWFWTSLSCWMGLNVQSMQPHLLIWNYLDGWLLVHLKFLNSPRYQSTTVFQIEALTRAQRYDCYRARRLVSLIITHPSVWISRVSDILRALPPLWRSISSSSMSRKTELTVKRYNACVCFIDLTPHVKAGEGSVGLPVIEIQSQISCEVLQGSDPGRRWQIHQWTLTGPLSVGSFPNGRKTRLLI